MTRGSDPLDPRVTRRLVRQEVDPFPTADGTAATDAVVTCPYCGETVDIALDPGSGASQTYIEDCAVCCRPWIVSVRYRTDGTAQVDVRAE